MSAGILRADCSSEISASQYLVLILTFLILGGCAILALAERTKITLSRSLDAKPRTPSRVEMKSLADLRTQQRFPNPDPRPYVERIIATSQPVLSAVALAAQIDVLESGAVSARSAGATSKARRSSTKQKKDARVASGVKRSPRNIKQESTYEITLRNLIVADLMPPTKRL